MDLSGLDKLQQLGKKSYNDQKSLIKKVLAGRKVLCSSCKQAIVFIPATDTRIAKVCCSNRCTDIELEIS